MPTQKTKQSENRLSTVLPSMDQRRRPRNGIRVSASAMTPTLAEKSTSSGLVTK